MSRPAPSQPSLLVVYATAVLVLTPVQLMAPAFPAIRDALGISSAEVAMLITVYMVPAAITSVPAGVIADRWGRKNLLVAAVATIGAGGLVIFWAPTYPLMLAVRVVQGAAYGATQTLTITIIGDLRRGSAQAGAQGMRSVLLALGGAVLPAAGGALVLLHWRTGFAVQGVCLLLAWVLHRRLPESAAVHRSGGAARGGSLRRAAREPVVLVLAGSGLLRFSLKYVFLTFLPIVYVHFHDDNSVVIGLLLSASSLSGMVGALTVRRWLGVLRASAVLIASTALAGLALALIGTGSIYGLLVLGVVLFGFGDSVSSVCQNALISVAVDGRSRGTAVAISAAGRNTGKFLGPAVVGPLTALVALPSVFLWLGAAAVGIAFSLRPVARVDHRLREPAEPEPSVEDRP